MEFVYILVLYISVGAFFFFSLMYNGWQNREYLKQKSFEGIVLTIFVIFILCMLWGVLVIFMFVFWLFGRDKYM